MFPLVSRLATPETPKCRVPKFQMPHFHVLDGDVRSIILNRSVRHARPRIPTYRVD